MPANSSFRLCKPAESRRPSMAGKVKVWFDAEADSLGVRFSEAAGYEKETRHDAVMDYGATGSHLHIPHNPLDSIQGRDELHDRWHGGQTPRSTSGQGNGPAPDHGTVVGREPDMPNVECGDVTPICSRLPAHPRRLEPPPLPGHPRPPSSLVPRPSSLAPPRPVAILLAERLPGGNPDTGNSNEKDPLCASATVPETAGLKAAI